MKSMCFSKEVSLATYLIGNIGCLALAHAKHMVEAAFFAYVLLMQLVEYVLWCHQPCDDVNRLATKCGIVINHCEPLVLYGCLLVFTTNNRLLQNLNRQRTRLLMLLYTMVSILYTAQTFTGDCSTVTEFSKPHIFWSWNYARYSDEYYVFFLALMNYLEYTCMENGLTCCVVTTASYILSYAIYYKTKAVGSMWCFFVAFDPYMLLLAYHLHKKPPKRLLN